MSNLKHRRMVINEEIAIRFRTKCELEGLAYGSVIRQLMEDVLNE